MYMIQGYMFLMGIFVAEKAVTAEYAMSFVFVLQTHTIAIFVIGIVAIKL